MSDQDKKVSVDWSCTADYLENLIEWEDWIMVYKDTCKMKVKIDDTRERREQPRAAITLSTTYKRTGVWDSQLLTVAWMSDVLEYKPSSWMVDVADRITATKDWDYVVTISVMAEVNDAVHALRFEIASNKTAFTWSCWVKFWWWYSDWWQTVDALWNILPATWHKMPIFHAKGWWPMIMTFSNSRILQWVQVWDFFQLAWRASFQVWGADTIIWAPYIFVVWNDGTWLTPSLTAWEHSWATLELRYIWPSAVSPN